MTPPTGSASLHKLHRLSSSKSSLRVELATSQHGVFARLSPRHVVEWVPLSFHEAVFSAMGVGAKGEAEPRHLRVQRFSSAQAWWVIVRRCDARTGDLGACPPVALYSTTPTQDEPPRAIWAHASRLRPTQKRRPTAHPPSTSASCRLPLPTQLLLGETVEECTQASEDSCDATTTIRLRMRSD